MWVRRLTEFPIDHLAHLDRSLGILDHVGDTHPMHLGLRRLRRQIPPSLPAHQSFAFGLTVPTRRTMMSRSSMSTCLSVRLTMSEVLSANTAFIRAESSDSETTFQSSN